MLLRLLYVASLSLRVRLRLLYVARLSLWVWLRLLYVARLSLRVLLLLHVVAIVVGREAAAAFEGVAKTRPGTAGDRCPHGVCNNGVERALDSECHVETSPFICVFLAHVVVLFRVVVGVHVGLVWVLWHVGLVGRLHCVRVVVWTLWVGTTTFVGSVCRGHLGMVHGIRVWDTVRGQGAGHVQEAAGGTKLQRRTRSGVLATTRWYFVSWG